MINRILIRIKVIQILYSFLLVEKQFTLESNPSAPTKEKRFAYALYLDMLVLLIKVSGRIERRKGEYPLKETRFISRLMNDDTIKSLLAKYANEHYPFAPVVSELADTIQESGIYKKYLKDSSSELGSGQEHLWRDIFTMIVMADPKVGELMALCQNYTLRGVERMHGMMNHTFSNFLASQDNVSEVEQALLHSLDKARELYLRLLWLPVELTDLQDRILDENRYKHLKSEEDVNPNMRFVENQLVDALRRCETLQNEVENNKLSWMTEDPILLRKLLKSITSSEVYQNYMQAPATTLAADCELWRQLYKKVILDNEDFLQSLEDRSVFWNDDLEIISTFVLKSFRRVEEQKWSTIVLDKFKDDEDRRFGSELLRYLYENKETYRRYIDEAIDRGKWETERLAFMDMVILETALAEILNFPKIPLVASINEYIELAKSYSSAKSGQFVNGILANVIKNLKTEGVITGK